MIEKIQSIKEEIEALKVSKSEDLENIRIKYLSKKGEISQLFNDFRTVAAEQTVSYTHLTLPTSCKV